MIDTLKKYICKFDYQTILTVKETNIQIFSDNKESVETIQERLIPHFPYKEKHEKNISFSICNIKNVNFDLYTYYSSLKNWKKIKHMNSVYNVAYNLEKECIVMWESKIGNTSILIHDEKTFLYLYDETENAKLSAMRMVRCIAYRELYLSSKHMTYYHTAAISYKGKGILLCGHSGNGKTSTLLNFLNNSNKENELIANDKVFLIPRDNEIYCYGWPTVVTIGVGSLKQYTVLEKYLTNIDDITCNQTLYEYVPDQKYLTMSKEEIKKLSKEHNKLAMSHSKLANLFNKKIKPESKVDLILFVQLGWENDENILQEITKKEKKQIIKNNFVNNISDQQEWLGYNKIKNNSQKKIVKEITKTIPVYIYKSNFEKIDLTKVLENIF